MKNLYALSFWLLLFSMSLTAQKHDYIWYFGYANNSSDSKLGGMTMTFHQSPPRIYPEKKKIDLGLYTCICSDSSGHMAFYTNGISIQNKTHNLMENGDTINPGYLWNKYKTQSYTGEATPMAIPAPGYHNHYYLIHLATELDNDYYKNPLYYSLIDMNANNGLGKVVKKNQVLIQAPAKGSLLIPVITKHGNGRDWWIVTGVYDEPIQYVFLVSPSGISGPFIQQIGPPFPASEGGANNVFSPDGNTYVRTDARNGLRIYDFDRCAGLLSNLRIVPYTKPFYTYRHAISPNSQFLYGQTFTEIAQFDLRAPDIGASLDTVAVFDGFVVPFLPFTTEFMLGGLGPDGKIYFATSSSTMGIHVINRPNLPGSACDFQQHAIILPKFNDGTMPRFPNYRLGQWQDSPCDTLPHRPAGDGFTPTPYLPVHTDTSYRLLTPVPDKTQSPDIYFRRKDLPNPPEAREWWEMMKSEGRTMNHNDTHHD